MPDSPSAPPAPSPAGELSPADLDSGSGGIFDIVDPRSPDSVAKPKTTRPGNKAVFEPNDSNTW